MALGAFYFILRAPYFGQYLKNLIGSPYYKASWRFLTERDKKVAVEIFRKSSKFTRDLTISTFSTVCKAIEPCYGYIFVIGSVLIGSKSRHQVELRRPRYLLTMIWNVIITEIVTKKVHYEADLLYNIIIFVFWNIFLQALSPKSILKMWKLSSYSNADILDETNDKKAIHLRSFYFPCTMHLKTIFLYTYFLKELKRI